MARLPRLTLAGHAHHVIQRGNNRQAIVLDDTDRQQLMDLVFEQARAHGVAVHAWALMDNHLHLLLTPSTADGVPRTMQAVGRAYVRRFNNRHGRSGTLWDGRYKSTLVQEEGYLLACMAHIELHPVREGLVSDPRDYAWSSHRHHIGQRVDRQLTPHPVYWALGNTPFAREAAYGERVRAGLSAEQQRAIADATLHGWALGDAAFVQALQKHTERRVARSPRGRPPMPVRADEP
ncbi:transposase [Hydrogenophaga sp. T2]|uniref:transposase n=1 Tax=Hydrogenophaga sp. T2 TaxID=3132823 RepID=UPI003CF8702B